MKYKKIIKLAAFNITFAIAMVVFFSPGLLGLGFTGPAFRVAFSAAVAATSVTLFVMVNKNLIQQGKENILLNDAESNWDTLNEELSRHYGSKILGSISTDAHKQIIRYNESANNYKRLIEKKFSVGSMSYSKFISILDNMDAVIKKNITDICNRCAIFNEKDYLSLQDYKNDNIDDAIQEERIEIYKTNLSWMRTLLEGTEKLLFSLDKLMLEISNADFSEKESEKAASQIKQLIEQLKYYGK